MKEGDVVVFVEDIFDEGVCIGYIGVYVENEDVWPFPHIVMVGRNYTAYFADYEFKVIGKL